MILIIDTSHDDSFRIGVARPNGSLIRSSLVQERRVQSERLLPEIKTVLAAAQGALRNVQGIIVAIGPGGFTSLRAGISTANALSYGLQIPIVGMLGMAEMPLEELTKRGAAQLRKQKSRTPVQPQYGRPPTITTPRKHLGE
ncbi:MAG: tRNA (adenosine(37)-N6)-threonylcarbamoyltransferase complex dimerization subunit type 1 TsaB [Patescibacteria group bacterium]|nr:tRNA (adenosine(37)-N6)-threonylcarbamoyltransferase complex dimerization subunit type 1 TsaB [Patescibacteria group bacterium]MDD5715233.1 tRNA (adenosine(37)-N6)-threonylcarbamoyltransferase complex dimerization subunit type 1 TsaB [Patescibacteria group bacterium]